MKFIEDIRRMKTIKLMMKVFEQERILAMKARNYKYEKFIVELHSKVLYEYDVLKWKWFGFLSLIF
jgi:hypothetical protein